MIATSLMQAVAPQPVAAFVAGGRVFGFHAVTAANDRIACCSDCGRQAGDARARTCRESGCPFHARSDAR